MELELERIAGAIKKKKAGRVCIQLPDGLKPKAGVIADFLEKKTNAEIFIWFSSCFGACDIPAINNIDLLVQFGHSEFI